MRVSAPQIVGQVVLYALFVAFIGYFATQPVYRHLDPGAARITLSFSHAGESKTECRRLTPEEIAALPPNMRRPMDCPRGRVPLLVELLVDGDVLYRASLEPSGLAGDGSSTAFEQFTIVPGTHRLSMRLRDSRREQGFDYETEENVKLDPGEHLVIDFRADTGGFVVL
jgi:hypothetical protein